MNARFLLAGSIALAAAPAFATVSQSGSVTTGVRATLGTAVNTETNTSSAVAPTAVAIGSAAQASSTAGDFSVFTFASTNARWTSADAGTIDLTWGWEVKSDGSGLPTGAETSLAYPQGWAYTFTATGDGSFSGRYNIMANGTAFGLQPLYTTGDWTSGPLGGSFDDPTGSGSFSIALLSGQTYTFSLAQFGNIGGFAGFDVTGDASAHVDWFINYTGGVPEPASWALLIAGFGVMGAIMRRQRIPAV